MEQAVLKINGEIEDKHGRHYFDRSGPVQVMEQSPFPSLRQDCKSDGTRWQNDPNQKRIQHRNSEVARPARPACNGPWPPWQEPFNCREQDQNADRTEQTDQRLVLDYRLVHSSILSLRGHPGNRPKSDFRRDITAIVIAASDSLLDPPGTIRRSGRPARLILRLGCVLRA